MRRPLGMKPGLTLGMFRRDVRDAVLYKQRQNETAAKKVLSIAEKRVFSVLLRRRGMSAVMRWSHTINRVLERAAQKEEERLIQAVVTR